MLLRLVDYQMRGCAPETFEALPGATIILEQPEIHLHPSAQASPADVFIDVINNRHLKLIVKSHREHLLRRIAEGAIAPEDTAIYFYHCNAMRYSETIRVRVPAEIAAWVRQRAEQEGRTISEIVREAVDAYLSE